MLQTRKSLLAKLLAKENVTVQHGAYRTASFDVVKRVLRLPIWEGISSDLYDLLVGHEVGHAEYTPDAGWHESDVHFRFPRSYINIIEDIRIERKIQEKYPGLKLSFKKGYKELVDRDFFGTADLDINTLGFLDRLNIKAKVRDLMDVKFNDDEIPYVKMAADCETFEDVIECCDAIYDFLQEKREKQDEQDPQSPEELSSGSDDEDSSDQNSSSYDESESSDEESEGEAEQQPVAGDEDDQESESDQSSASSEPQQEDQVDSLGSYDSDTLTDDTFREKEDTLVSQDIKDSDISILPYTDEMVDRIVIDYKTLSESRKDNVVPEYIANDYKAMMSENDKVSQTLAKEFEMRKAAFQYSRAKTSKTGQLDVTKLANYKFTDDLFLSNTTLADAKSHGLFMLIDFSGSMNNILRNVINQTIVLAMFCRKVNIPFEVYSFTSSYKSLGIDRDYTSEYMQMDHLCFVQQLKSGMSKSEFKDATMNLFAMGDRYYHAPSEYDRLGNTPSIESLVIAEKLISRFKKKYGAQKTNFVMISDGSPTHPQIRMPSHLKPKLVMGNTLISLDFFKSSKAQADIVEYIGRTCNTHCFYIAARPSAINGPMYAYRGWEHKKELQSGLRKQKYASLKDFGGFNHYHFISGDMSGMDGDFEVEGSDIKDIRKAFKKFASSKKGNRVMCVEFAKAIS